MKMKKLLLVLGITQSFAMFANDNLEKGLFGRVAVAEGATKA